MTISGTARRRGPILAVRILIYLALYFLTAMLFGRLFVWIGGYLVGVTATGLLAAIFTNWLSLKIYENRHIVDLGLWWNRASMNHLGLGIAGGAAAAALVLVPPLAFHAAHFTSTPAEPTTAGTVVFILAMLALGAAGEELLFRGYGFQVLLRAIGPYATIVPVGFVFALLHSDNPHASYFGLANTAG